MVELRTIVVGDAPDALRSLGLAVDEEGRAVVGGVTIAAVGVEDGRGIVGLDVSGVAPGVLPSATGARAPAAPMTGEHPLGAVAVDHIVVLCGDVDATLLALGITARKREERDGRVYAYVVATTALLELVGPVEAEARPSKVWGIALSVTDLDAAIDSLGEACGEAKPAFQPGRRIATVRHEQLGLSVPTVLLSARS